MTAARTERCLTCLGTGRIETATWTVGCYACDGTGRGTGHSRRRVLLASPRGFCAGVERAVATVERALELFGAPVYVRRQIVHNRHVVESLTSSGAIFVDEVDEVPQGAVVIFSAHGVTPTVREAATARRLRTIDATCPLVTKVHHEARRLAAAGYDILLIGEHGHDEIIGTLGEARERIQVVAGPHDVARVTVTDPERVAWLSQTTLAVDETAVTVARLRERFPRLKDPPSDDICYAAQNRQAAVAQLATRAELVLVVGSRNSHNSAQLVTVALDAGANAAHLIDDSMQIDEMWLRGVSTVGVTAGASAPEAVVRGVLEWLAARGYSDVEEIQSAHEGQTFALPRDLARGG